MSEQAKYVELDRRFKEFDPQTMAFLEKEVVLANSERNHKLAFNLQVVLVKHQFGLSEEAATRVVQQHRRPNLTQPLAMEGLPGYFAQLSQETGLGFTIEPEIWQEKDPAERLSKIFSQVYNVPEKKLLPLMKIRYRLFDQDIDDYEAMALQYYQGLKKVISTT